MSIIYMGASLGIFQRFQNKKACGKVSVLSLTIEYLSNMDLKLENMNYAMLADGLLARLIGYQKILLQEYLVATV